MLKLFKRRQKAMVFVDYEYWFYSYRNLYSMRPDPVKFLEALKKEFYIADTMVFADFSVPVISTELRKLRSITNTIIETGNTLMRRKKDMTDFVMLDYIYRCADDNKSVDTYIIFSGDGHFQSVVKHLSQRKKKRVIVYGIRDTVSRQLLDVADEVRLLPSDAELNFTVYRLVAANMAEAESKAGVTPSFKTTVNAVVAKTGEPEERIRQAVSEMLEKGYLYQTHKFFGKKAVKVINADWDKMTVDGVITSKKDFAAKA